VFTFFFKRGISIHAMHAARISHYFITRNLERMSLLIKDALNNVYNFNNILKFPFSTQYKLKNIIMRGIIFIIRLIIRKLTVN
jgi:hypothetical protein